MRAKARVNFGSPVLRRPEALREALEPGVAKAALDVERDIKGEMRAPKSGRTYRRGAVAGRAPARTRALGGGRAAVAGFNFHRASAPGEAPAVDLGELINSYTTVVFGLRASVGSPLERAAWLEEGTRYIAPRPAAAPAAGRAGEAFPRQVNEAVKGVL